MVGMAPAALVDGPVRQPLPYGLFSALSLRPQGSDRWESGARWEPLTCAKADGIGQYQAPPTSTTGLPKNLAGNLPANGLATPFTVYGHFTCSPVGWTQAAAQEQAVAHLLNREEYAVEAAFWTGSLGNLPSLQLPGTGNGYPATATVGTGTTDIVGGLGLLEDYIGDNYGSLGVIHVTRATALAGIARLALVTSGGRLTTALGTPVVAGSGYPGTGPAGQAAAAGTQWAFASPALLGYRSEVFDSSNGGNDLFDRGLNTMYAVAERSYLLGFDPCGTAAVLIDTD